MQYIFQLDSLINQFFQNNIIPGGLIHKFFLAITNLANYQTILLLAIFLSFFLFYKDNLRWGGKALRGYILPLWVALATSQGIVFFLKNFFQTSGPLNRILFETDFAFPSGHTAGATVFYGTLCFLFIKNNPRLPKKKKIFLATIAIGIIFLVALSRLVLDVHFFSDIVAGLLVGLFGFNIGKTTFHFLNK